MVVLDSLLEYSVVEVDADMESDAYNVMQEYMVNIDQHCSLATRDKRVLKAIVSHYINECRCIGVRHFSELVGVVMVDDYNKNFISHVGISKQHINSTGSGLLMNYVLNVMFDGEDVYVQSKNVTSFKSIIEPTNVKDVFKIKDSARYVIRKLVKGE